jgi:PBSX family phage portal protein
MNSRKKKATRPIREPFRVSNLSDEIAKEEDKEGAFFGDAERGFDELTERGLNDRFPLVKAHFLGSDGSNVKPIEERSYDERIFSREGALSPPYSPEVLCKIHEHSNALRQNIDAYCVNIDGNGHRFDPVIDLEADEAFEKVRDAMFIDRISISDDEGKGETPDFPSDEEVEATIDEMEDEMRLEKARVETFFRFCCLDESFISLRKRTRQDLEIMGNGFWEVIRDDSGSLVQFTYIPGFTSRLMPLDSSLVETTTRIKRTPISFQNLRVNRRFRRFVQVFEGARVFFKEFGDPRIMSSQTGEYYKDVDALEKEEGKGISQATEVIHFSIHSPRSAYGIPRWIGTLLAVLGSRQAEEVNFLYFENKSVPPLAILVSGGTLSKDSASGLQDYIKTHLKGRQNFHKILVIEGVSSSASLDGQAGRMRIEIVPLTGAQQKDALFQSYDERNIDKIGMSFRLPRLLRGDIRDFNRGTAEAALEFAEMQVFAPEREDFDWFINRKIIAELGIRYWEFRSNSPNVTNPIDLAEMISQLVREAILTPEEARELAQGIFNRDFKRIDEIWTKIPPKLLISGILPENVEGFDLLEPDEKESDDETSDNELEDVAEKVTIGKRLRVRSQRLKLSKRYRKANRARGLRKLAQDLVSLRNVLDEAERIEAKKSFNISKAELNESGDIADMNVPRETIEVPEAELARFFEDRS